MKLENQELLKEFYERVKNDYPELTQEQIKECCTTQYSFVRKNVESGKLPAIRLKYFGTFLVYPKRAKSILTRLKKQFNEHKITPKEYFEKKSIIDNFLKDEKED